MSSDAYVAEIGWRVADGIAYVNANDLVAMLRAGGYTDLADDFERIAAEEAESRG